MNVLADNITVTDYEKIYETLEFLAENCYENINVRDHASAGTISDGKISIAFILYGDKGIKDYLRRNGANEKFAKLLQICKVDFSFEWDEKDGMFYVDCKSLENIEDVPHYKILKTINKYDL
jgi:hypothetical protein